MTFKFQFIFLLFFSLSVFNTNAQTVKIDSLKVILETHLQQDTTRVNLLNKIADHFQHISPDKSQKYFTEAYRIADSLKYVKGKAEALYQTSNYHTTISNFDKVLEYAEQSLVLFKEIKDSKGIAKNMLIIGDIYYFQGEVEKALDFKKKALAINIAIKDSVAICHSYANLGTNYCDIGNFALALEYEEKALDIAYKINNQNSISYALNNLGVVHDIQGNYPKALECYQKSFRIDEKQNNYKDAAVSASNVAYILSLQNNYEQALIFCQKGIDYSIQIGFKTGLTYNYEYMGFIFKTKGDYEKAWENHQKALTLQIEIGNKTGIANAYKDLAEIYYLQEKYTDAIAYYNKSLVIGKDIENMQIEMKAYVGLSVIYIHIKNYQLAQKYSQKAYSMANNIGNIELLKQSAEVLAQSKAALGQYKEAYKLHVIFKNMSDSLYNEKNIRSIANLEYQYKYEKEKEVLKLEQQKKDAIHSQEEKQQKIIRDSLILGLGLVLMLTFAVLHSLLQKRKANHVLAKQKEVIEEKNKELTVQKEDIQVFAHELEKANKTKDKFFSIIAHDLKSPFNGILGFAELLLENHTQYDDKERETYIRYINDCSIKTYNLLDNMLTWAQSQTGIIKFTPTDVNVEHSIDEIISLLTESAENKNIKLVSMCQDDLLVSADKNMLHTIILNLVSNAIKFTHKGGEITLKAKKISTKNKHVYAEISIKDNGIGIAQNIQSKLFKITETISTKGTEEENGTGLGLILCKEFVDKHDGKIWVNSEAKKGSEFIFTIPMTNNDCL